MLELVFELLGELLIQLIGELLLEIFLHRIPDFLRGPFHPWLAAFGYLILGAAAGGLSLLVIPNLLLATENGKIINLVLTPLVVGMAMAQLGNWRRKQGRAVLRIDRFACGYLFALAFAAIRYWLAK